MKWPRESVLGCVVAALAFSAFAAPILQNPQPIPIPIASASDLLTADFNRDGHPDLLLVDPGRSLAAFLDNGTGPFATPVVSSLPYATGRPAIADVNSDGITDVVVSDWSTATIAVMLGHGDGTFTQGLSFGSISLPGPLAVADLNGDGDPDIAVASSDSHSGSNVVAVYVGDGTGHFSGGTTTTVGSDYWSITPADMNLDGKMDLFVGGYPGIQFLLGDGHGGFAPHWLTSDGQTVAIGDFNHDGKPDLAIAAGGTHQWFVEVNFGNGDGTFRHSARYAVGYNSGSIEAVDIDGDANVDLLAAGTLGSAVTVLRGKPDGTFHQAELFVSGPGTWKIVTGDFDRDGSTDFVTLDYNANEVWAMSFVRGNGDGTFRSYRGFHTSSIVPVVWPGLSATGGAVADMNNDGKPDVVVIQQHPPAHSCDLGVMLNDGTGELAKPRLTDTGKQVWTGNPTFAVGDVNRDGRQDAVVLSDFAGELTAETLLGDGTGGFSAPIPFEVAGFGQPTLGKFNDDTVPDLFVPSNYFATVSPGNGDGTFGTSIRSETPASNVLVGDINGDGTLDYVSSFVRSVNACMNDGTGGFSCRTVTSNEVSAAALADFNDDGRLDLLLTTYTGTQTLFGNGDGTFGTPVSVTITPAPNYPSLEPVTTADFDGDGNLDVAFGTTVYVGNGDGTFRSRARFRTTAAGLVTAADLDGSGSPDLVVTKTSADDVDVLLTRTTEDPAEWSSIELAGDRTLLKFGQTVTLTASIVGSAIPLSGAVVFAVDGRPSALITVSRAGIATWAPKLDVGFHTIGATYTGDEYYRSSTAYIEVIVSRMRRHLRRL